MAERHPSAPPRDGPPDPPAREGAHAAAEERGARVEKRGEQQGEKKDDPGSSGDSEPSVGTRLSAHEIHDNVKRAAEEELERPSGALAFSAVAAGITITASFLASAWASTLADGERLKEALAAAAYPLGFVLVVIGRQQLFTENTLEPVIPLLDRFTGRRFAKMMRLWAVVLAGNIVGGLLMAFFAARTEMVPHELRLALDRVAEHTTEGGFTIVFWRAIFAGWLVAMMAWLVAATRMTGAQIALIWLTTAPIAALGFRHSIAGAVEAFYRALRGGAPWDAMLGDFLLPAVLGNAVGGVLLVALLNHGQVAHGKE